MQNSPVVRTLKQPVMSVNLLDRFISVFKPRLALERVRSRMALSALSAPGYITPGKNKRSMAGWFTSGGSADFDTIAGRDLEYSRRGSRDLYMNTPIATGALRRLKTNVLGKGLKLQSRIDREFLGLTNEAADAWERKAEREWNLWANSKECDITRTNNFNQLQKLTFLSMLLSGDVFCLLPHKKVKGFPYSLHIQLIEGDQVCNPNNFDNMWTSKLRAGVEIDGNGAPVAYHIRTKHPGDTDIEQKWVRVPAFGQRSGRRNVLHLYSKERPGQRRGMPFLAPVMEQLKQLTRLADAELMAALVNAFFTVFIKNTPQIRPLGEGYVPGEQVSDVTTDEGEKVYEMGSGNIVSLDEQEEPVFADPKRPNDSFEPFFMAMVKQIGVGLEIPYEVLMMCFNSNYSASRAAILAFWKTVTDKRSDFIADYNQPVYEEFLTEAVSLGRLAAPGFLLDPLKKAAWCGTRWGGPGQGQIDPLKETKAARERINGRLSSHEDESQLLGTEDWEATMNRLAREETLLDEKELNPVAPEEPTVEETVEEKVEEGVASE